VQGKEKQEELVTGYNSRGQTLWLTRQLLTFAVREAIAEKCMVDTDTCELTIGIQTGG